MGSALTTLLEGGQGSPRPGYHDDLARYDALHRLLGDLSQWVQEEGDYRRLKSAIRAQKHGYECNEPAGPRRFRKKFDDVYVKHGYVVGESGYDDGPRRNDGFGKRTPDRGKLIEAPLLCRWREY